MMSAVEQMDMDDFKDSEARVSSPKKSGWFISPLVGAVLVVVAVVVVILVGVIVHFTTKDQPSNCPCLNHYDASSMSTDPYWQNCLNVAKEKNICLSAPHCADGTGSSAWDTEDVTPLPKDVRLPTDVVPTYYNLHLKPDMYTDDTDQFQFEGSVEIFLNCTKSTSVIIVHIDDLTIEESSIKVDSLIPGQTGPGFSHTEQDDARQFYKVHLSGQLKEGHRYVLFMNFSGKLKDNLSGLYYSSYEENGIKRYIVTSQMEPTDARSAFPCFDEPGLKAQFNVTLYRKAPMKALSNMPLVSSENKEDGWIEDHFQETVTMSTYLLAFVICDFSYKERFSKNGIRVRVWARRSAIEQVDYALDTGVTILDYYEEYFGIPFPLPKQDMIAIPDFSAGAMENWGLITYRETMLLYVPKVSSYGNKQNVATAVSHELAHQWFGNLVSPAWWDDLWLNEGFATYVEYIGMDITQPDWKMDDLFVVIDSQSALRSDGLGSSHPLFVPVKHPDEISEIFDSISYAKGGSVIRMMKYFLGEDTFLKGLRKYLKRFSYGNARHVDLWQALDEQAKADGMTDVDVGDVMDTWTVQMGYPLVTIRRSDSQPNKATVTQEHFLLDPSQGPSDKYTSPFNYKWIIPLTYTTSSRLEWRSPPLVWMDKGDASLDGLGAGSDWILANIDQQGYFRVNYDEDNWRKLIDQLNTDHRVIPAKNRAQIIDDAFTIGRSGGIDTVYSLKAIQYLPAETEYIPISAFTSNIAYFDDMLKMSPAFGLFKRYLLGIILPLYNRLGRGNIGENDPLPETYKRITILKFACAYGHKPCQDEASTQFKRWMNNPQNNPIHPDLKNSIYCNAIQAGGEAEWEFAFGQWQQTNVASEKAKLQRALACTQIPWLLNKYLWKTLESNEIRKQDAPKIISYIASNTLGRYMTWDFIRENWAELRERYGSQFFSIRRIISGVTWSFNKQLELQQLREFVSRHGNLGTAKRALEQATERTAANIRWMETNEQKVHQWLKDNVSV